MRKSVWAVGILLCGSLASAISLGVIVPYEEEPEKPVKKKELTEAQKKQEALFQERLKARDAQRQRAKEAKAAFERELRQKRREQKQP